MRHIQRQPVYNHQICLVATSIKDHLYLKITCRYASGVIQVLLDLLFTSVMIGQKLFILSSYDHELLNTIDQMFWCVVVLCCYLTSAVNCYGHVKTVG